ncbi:MAG: hypothetical protein ACYTFW_04145 [Planctomycetota bacterium]|jgi:hypothetical protein
MRQNVRNSGKTAKRLFEQLAVEKKKTVTAICLITVMAFMWLKVLTRNTPEAAEAAFETKQENAEGLSNPDLKVSFIELPNVVGRNDVITRDFFASDGWQQFDGGKGRNLTSIEEVNIVSKDGSEEVVRKVAEKLKLEAIMLSSNPRAFINNNVLSVGGKVLIGDGFNKYECEVIEIKEDTVVVKCREAEITLKLHPIVNN